jgi:radical SAM protein with 4Fe4S-binding SPASM domain
MDATQEFFVQWHLTERCNLRCRHCYQTGSGGSELDLAQLLDLVDEVAETLEAWSTTYDIAFSGSLNVTGGEPLLRADLFEFLEHARSRGLRLYLLSNGTLVSRDVARRLAALGVEGVQVSLEGPEEVHDGIRGTSSFRRALEGVAELRGAGVPVSLNATLSRLNVPYLGDMVGIAKGTGVERIAFSRLVPSGRGAGLLDQMLRPDEVRAAYEALAAVAVEDVFIGTGDPIAAQLGAACAAPAGGAPAQCTAIGGCAAGVSGLTLLPDGTVHPCRRLPIPLGNLREDSLRELWATSEILQRLRDKTSYRGRCGSCERWSNCRGCRAIAYACTGDFLADDPQCFLTADETGASQ